MQNKAVALENLEILTKIVQLRFDLERSRLSQKMALVSAVEQSLALLETQAQQSTMDTSDEFVQMQLGTGVNWQNHLSRTQTSVRQNLQTAQAHVDCQRNQFSTAFGEKQALASLRSNQEDERKIGVQRKEADQVSQILMSNWNYD